jgi:hypothetical protein
MKNTERSERRANEALDNFMASIHGLTLDEALANAELDARSYGWTREQTRALGGRIRAHFSRRLDP